MDLPKKGQKIYCQKCNEPLFEFLVDIQEGMPVFSYSTTKSFREKPYEPSEKVTCHHCGNDNIDARNFR